MGDTPGSGIWNWPNASASSSPSRASNPSVYAGLHSHDDGVIHMEPVTSDEAGKNATVGTYFDFGGWKLSSTGYSFLGTTVKNGDKCGNSTGTLQWEVGSGTAPTASRSTPVQTGNPRSYKLFDGDIVSDRVPAAGQVDREHRRPAVGEEPRQRVERRDCAPDRHRDDRAADSRPDDQARDRHDGDTRQGDTDDHAETLKAVVLVGGEGTRLRP